MRGNHENNCRIVVKLDKKEVKKNPAADRRLPFESCLIFLAHRR